VELDGGTLKLEWREADGHVLMTGPGKTVFLGQLDLDAYGN
jgi:diaminopimelate epimerase